MLIPSEALMKIRRIKKSVDIFELIRKKVEANRARCDCANVNGNNYRKRKAAK